MVRGLGYAAILKNNQLSPSRAVENLGKVFWVPGFEIASCVICRFPLISKSPNHAVHYDFKAVVVRQWFKPISPRRPDRVASGWPEHRNIRLRFG